MATPDAPTSDDYSLFTNKANDAEESVNEEAGGGKQDDSAKTIPDHIVDTTADFFGLTYEGSPSSRTIAVSVINNSPLDWKHGQAYLKHGVSDTMVPESVNIEGTMHFSARKTKGSLVGVQGIVSFQFAEQDLYLAVAFDIPFNYLFFENYWNVKTYSSDKRENKKWLEELCSLKSEPFQGDGCWYRKDINNGLVVKGCMCNSSAAVLHLYIYPSHYISRFYSTRWGNLL